MKRRLLTILAVATILGGFHEWTPPAHAELANPDCGHHLVDVADWSISSDHVDTLWDFQCSGSYNVQWGIVLTLQYQNSSGGWQAFYCDNGQKCQVNRPPLPDWYDPGTRHSGGNAWNIAGQIDCKTIRFHANVTFQNTGFSLYDSRSYQIGGC